LVRGKINCSPGYYDPDETVLINPKNFGLGKRQGEKSRQYLVFIALPDEEMPPATMCFGRFPWSGRLGASRFWVRK